MENYYKILKKILNGKSEIKYRFHFVGIGGVSMSSLAQTLIEAGMEVSGSDTKTSDNVKKLKKLGVKIYNHHDTQNVAGADFCIYSFAVEDNVETREAKRLKIPTISRAELLGIFLKCHKISICVAGAHGKTTTTALIYSILEEAGINPSLHLGGYLAKSGRNYFNNSKECIVCEACEYKDAFLNLKPSIGIVLNTAPEHLDYFKTYENVKKSFVRFAKSASMLICSSEYNFLHNYNKITVGDKNANFTAKNLKVKPDGTYKFDCFKNGKFYRTFSLNLIGRHNVYNALFAVAVADFLGVRKDDINRAISNFEGIDRRFCIINKSPLIIHDYAHHPDEISTVIKELRTFYKGKLLVVFQPHTYSRTKKLLKEFSNCFGGEEVAIYKTFSAREKYDSGGSARKLFTVTQNSKYFKVSGELKSYVLSKISAGYAVIFLGAGDIDKIAKNIGNLC